MTVPNPIKNSPNFPLQKPRRPHMTMPAAEYRAFLGTRPPQSERWDFDLLSVNMGQYSDEFR